MQHHKTPLSLNHVTSSVEPFLGLTAISHSSGAPSLNKEWASALPLVTVFQCHIVTTFIGHVNSTFSVTNSLYEESKHVSHGPHAARQFILYDQLPDLSSVIDGSCGFIFQESLICRNIYTFISSQA